MDDHPNFRHFLRIGLFLIGVVKGSYREYRRLCRDLERSGRTFCPVADCENRHFSFQVHPDRYQRRGLAGSGHQRLVCKACRKTLTVSDRRRKSARINTFKDLMIFRLLVNQAHIRAISRVSDLSATAVYQAIDRIYNQCRRFAAHRERKLKTALKGRFINVAVDLQHYSVNWSNREDRRITVIPACASVDNITRYCFAMHLCFDDSIKQEDLERAAQQCGDNEKPGWAREHAQYWLQSDYDQARERALQEKIRHRQQRGRDTQKQPPEPELMPKEQKLPVKGVQTRSEYTTFAHFMYLSDLFEEVRSVQFSMDREPSIARAFLSAFADKVEAGTANGFLVQIEKGLGNDRRRGLVANASQLVAELAGGTGPFDKAVFHHTN